MEHISYSFKHTSVVTEHYTKSYLIKLINEGGRVELFYRDDSDMGKLFVYHNDLFIEWDNLEYPIRLDSPNGEYSIRHSDIYVFEYYPVHPSLSRDDIEKLIYGN